MAFNKRVSTKKTGGTKHDTDKAAKPSLSLLPTQPLLEIARVLDFGAAKYAAHNWRAGIDNSRLLDAALRHILANNEGETLDPESGLNHLAHAGCMILFALEQQLRATAYADFDNRFRADELEA